MLLPLAPTLKMLGLGGNKLGGTITDDIASFTKLKTLELLEMGLKGTFAHDPRYTGEREERTGERELGNGERSRIVPVARSRGVRRNSRVDRESDEPAVSQTRDE